MRNRTRERIASGDAAIGTMSMLGDPNAVEAMGHAGLDFVFLDMEHTERDMSGMLPLIRAANLTGMTPFVRIPGLDLAQIQRALDAGAEGIVVPGIRSAEQARTLARACAFPPRGTRGTCRYSRSAAAGKYAESWPAFVENADAEILSMALVEDPDGVQELEGIVEAVDIVLVGRGDLSTALGVPGQVTHPSVLEAIKRYEDAAMRQRKPLATMCYTVEEARDALARGYRYLMYGADVNVLYREYSSAVTALRAGR